VNGGCDRVLSVSVLTDWRADAQVIQTAPWREGALLVGLGYQASDGGRVLVINRRDGRVLDELMPNIESVRLAAALTE